MTKFCLSYENQTARYTIISILPTYAVYLFFWNFTSQVYVYMEIKLLERLAQYLILILYSIITACLLFIHIRFTDFSHTTFTIHIISFKHIHTHMWLNSTWVSLCVCVIVVCVENTAQIVAARVWFDLFWSIEQHLCFRQLWKALKNPSRLLACYFYLRIIRGQLVLACLMMVLGMRLIVAFTHCCAVGLLQNISSI